MKKLCDEFGLVNIFHGKIPNYEKSKIYQEGSMFVDYDLIYQDLIDKVDWVIYEPFGYQKGKGDHWEWYFDIQETDLFENQINGVYQSKSWSLYSKDSKQLPDYLRVVNKHLREHHIYQQIAKLMMSRRHPHEEAEEINQEITRAIQYGEQQCKNRHKDFWDSDVHILKMKKAFWCYLIVRKKHHLDTTVICAAAWEEGIEMYNTATLEELQIVQQIQEDLKEHYQDHKIKQNEYLLSKKNLESDAGEEVKPKTIRDIKKAEYCNQCCGNF